MSYTEKYNGVTELVFILDRSGSMSGLEADTIGGFNSMLKKQKEEEGEALVSVVLFDHEIEVLYNRVPVSSVPFMTEKTYYARGMTALLDAVGGAICHIRKVHELLGKAQAPDKTLFVIITDGMENASRKFSYASVKELLSYEEKVNHWEFLFLGANIDVDLVGAKMGIKKNRTVRFENDSEGCALNFNVVSDAIADVRKANMSACEPMLSDHWSDRIHENYKSRRNRIGKKS